MSVSYSASLKSIRMNAVISAIDTSGTGTIEIGSSGMAMVLVTIGLSKPSFMESNGVITMAGVPLSGSASNSGTAASADIKDGDGDVVVSGLTVGISGSGADIILDSTSLTVGQIVTMQSATITHSP